MQSRVMKINVVDDYGCHHDFKVTLRGEDVSNESLKSSNNSMWEKTESDLSVSPYDIVSIPQDILEKVLENDFDNDKHDYCEIEADSDIDKSTKNKIRPLDLLLFHVNLHLLMSSVSSEIENFSWSFNEDENDLNFINGMSSSKDGYEFSMDLSKDMRPL